MHVIPTYKVAVKDLNRDFRISESDLSAFISVLRFNNLTTFSVEKEKSLLDTYNEAVST
jgi:hypothetical protein